MTEIQIGHSFSHKGKKFLVIKHPVGANGVNYQAVSDDGLTYKIPAYALDNGYVDDLKLDPEWYAAYLRETSDASDKPVFKVAGEVRVKDNMNTGKLKSKVGYVVRVNERSISVLFPNDDVWKLSPNMLEIV